MTSTPWPCWGAVFWWRTCVRCGAKQLRSWTAGKRFRQSSSSSMSFVWGSFEMLRVCHPALTRRQVFSHNLWFGRALIKLQFLPLPNDLVSTTLFNQGIYSPGHHQNLDVLQDLADDPFNSGAWRDQRTGKLRAASLCLFMLRTGFTKGIRQRQGGRTTCLCEWARDVLGGTRWKSMEVASSNVPQPLEGYEEDKAYS